MATAAIQQVRPAGARHESLVLGLATLLVIAILLLYVRERGLRDTPEPLYDWQVSAFNTLTGADQAIYNALFTTKDDIPYLYDDINLMNPPGVKFHWPTLQELQEAALPPFLADTSWKQNGSLQWTLYEPLPEGEMQGSTMYLGTGGTQPNQGSFLLVIGHVHAGFTNNNSIVIWWNRRNKVEMPQSGFRDGLILQGWKEVVPYSGAQEVKRVFGDDAGNTGSDPTAGNKPNDSDEQAAEQAVQDLFETQ
jgi:hypothetical protein